MRIFVFGTGKYYKNNKKFFNELSQSDKLLGFVDNRAAEIPFCDGYPVYKPEEILPIDFDKIILMSASYREMQEQLLKLHLSIDKICYYEEYIGLKSQGSFKIFTKNPPLTQKKKILILTSELDYNGASIAIIYAAQCLIMRGYGVYIASKKGNNNFIREIVDYGLNVITTFAIPYIGTEELFWINQFDIIMVNTYQMIQCACEIIKIKPVLWWLHEPSGKYTSIYDNIRYCFSKYDDINMMNGIKICAVSEMAKKNFEEYYTKRVNEILPYGIPNKIKVLHNSSMNQKFVFAIIGSIAVRKAQNIFLNAVKIILNDVRQNTEFWIIGLYSREDTVVKMARNIQEVKLIGQITREQMQKSFPQIDVVVCPSLEDPMPIVVTEGMMHSKTCIVSDAVGQAQYINDGENGLICKAGDASSLAEKMKWCIYNRDKLSDIGKAARKIYEDIFTIEKFGERLEQALLKTERQYYDKKSCC